MNIKTLVIAVAIFSVIGFAMTSLAATSAPAKDVVAGDYKLGLANGQINYVKYNNTLIISYGFVSGSNLSSYNTPMSKDSGFGMLFNNSGNLSYASFVNGNSLVLATAGSGSEYIQLNFTSNLTAANSDRESFMDQDVVSAYYLNVDGYNFTVVSNGKVTNSHTNYTFTVQSNHFPSSNILYVLIVSNTGVNGMFQHFEHMLRGYKFTYDKTTGNVTGRYLYFNFYQSNETIQNFYDRLSGLRVFNNVSGMGNGSLNFPLTSSGPYVGNIFYYATSPYALMIHNNPTLQSSFIVKNGTVMFNVSNGISLTEKNITFKANEEFEANSDDMGLELNQSVYAGTSFVFMNAPHFYAMMTFVNGNVSVNSMNNTIIFKTNKTGFVNFVSPPGLSNGVNKMKPMQYALERGKLGLQMAFEKVNSTINNFTIAYNASVHALVKSVSSNGIVINVNSSETSGTVIAVYVTNNVINASRLIVKFDGSAAVQVSASALVNETSTTTAYYNVTADGNGSMVLIYVPHFSDHTIQIEPYTAVQQFSLTYYAAIIVVIVAIVAAIAYVFVKRKK